MVIEDCNRWACLKCGDTDAEEDHDFKCDGELIPYNDYIKSLSKEMKQVDPTILEAIKLYLTQILKEVIPDKDIKVSINIELNITKPQ